METRRIRRRRTSSFIYIDIINNSVPLLLVSPMQHTSAAIVPVTNYQGSVQIISFHKKCIECDWVPPTQPSSAQQHVFVICSKYLLQTIKQQSLTKTQFTPSQPSERLTTELKVEEKMENLKLNCLFTNEAETLCCSFKLPASCHKDCFIMLRK